MESPLTPKKKIDYEALNSALMRIPSMHFVVRGLIDIGICESYDLIGRDPSSLLTEMPLLKVGLVGLLCYLRM